MQQRCRYSDTQTQHRRHQRDGNTTRHNLRITCAEERDGLERLNHPDHSAKQTHERSDHGNHLDNVDELSN